MKMQINEFAKLAGVSIRTLHYYDEIGLLKPAFVDEQNGYRFYDEISLERMQEILFYRELDFELKSIAEILSSPDYDKQKALAEQRKLLILKKERLERIIAALDSAEKERLQCLHLITAIMKPPATSMRLRRRGVGAKQTPIKNTRKRPPTTPKTNGKKSTTD